MDHLFTHDVFISYSTKNKLVADALCHYLEQQKIRCWIAPRDIAPGREYGDEIDIAIKRARCFVIVFSKDSSESHWVRSETNLAMSDSKIIIPVRLDETELEGAMRLYLNDKHWIDAFPDPEKYFEKIAHSLQRFLQESSAASHSENDVIAECKKSKIASLAEKLFRFICLFFSSAIHSFLLISLLLAGFKVYFNKYFYIGIIILYPLSVLLTFLDYKHPVKSGKKIIYSLNALKKMSVFSLIINLIRLFLGGYCFFFSTIVTLTLKYFIPCYIIIFSIFCNNKNYNVIGCIIYSISLFTLANLTAKPIYLCGRALLLRDYAKFSFPLPKVKKWFSFFIIHFVIFLTAGFIVTKVNPEIPSEVMDIVHALSISPSIFDK